MVINKVILVSVAYANESTSHVTEQVISEILMSFCSYDYICMNDHLPSFAEWSQILFNLKVVNRG